MKGVSIYSGSSVDEGAKEESYLESAREYQAQGRQLLDKLNSSRQVIDQKVLDYRSKGQSIKWDSPQSKEIVERLLADATNFIEFAKEVEALSIKIDKEINSIINELKSFWG